MKLNHLVASGVLLLVSMNASAYSTGKTGGSCTGCHMGGTVPTVSLTGPTSLLGGAEGIYTLSFPKSATQTFGGFNVSKSEGGTFALDSAESMAKLASGEVTTQARS